MRYGTIGTGWITQSFIEGTRLIEDFELHAVYSRTQEKAQAFAKDMGAALAFSDLEAMAASPEIDAVYIASPNALHYAHSRLFLEAGKHVLCEKPLTANSQQAEELMALARSKNLIYLEAIMMLHMPQLKLLEAALPRIGAVHTARFDFSQRSSKYPAYLAGEMPNIFNPKLATGCLMDLGVYCVYPALHLFGQPEEIITTAGLLRTGSDGYLNSVFIYPDLQVNISCSKIGQSRLGTEILGDEGTLVIDSISKLTNMKIVYNDGHTEPIYGEDEKPVLMKGEAADFRNYILEPDRWTEEYAYVQELALRVSRTLERMRDQAGIRFQ
ncbi:Gfo/Idh/MocA family protein [Gehongia tenuis]|uniref:Gfo/Idh/MocA family oxidoreductase n=1 Tax=Gehongia tenuis TaxID=2763655 RepID=A0A926HPH8_9FIRM|nr:Gfo/Idh/MocA family oxidoreductase [Gehongia tenuis]MBC8531664.1 Gfo/Idh/MocA family oxidoreductase [Gehongia tenuis]